MKPANIIALDAARAKGASLPAPAPTVTPPDQAELAASAAQLQRELLEQTAAAIADLAGKSAVLTSLFEQVTRSVEQLRDAGVAPISAEALSALLSVFTANINTRLGAIEGRLAVLVQGMANMQTLQQRTIDTLGMPVVPQYDAEGRVIAAHRIPVAP